MADRSSDHGETLGSRIRRLRAATGLSLRALAARAEVDFSWLAKVERGEYQSPDPRCLFRLAEALDVEPANLYASAGYGEGLPTFARYLRAKYDLPDDAVAQLEAHFELVNERYQRQEGGRHDRHHDDAA